MRIPSGKTDQKIFFVAVDSTDLKTRETGLTTFTVYRSRNGGTATVYTTPTVAELDATNMPGVYSLLIDEDTTIASGSDSEEYCVHITQASMAPVTRTVELYRRDTTTGNTLDVTATGAAGMDWGNVENKTTSNALTGTTIATTQKVDVETIKTNAVVNGGTVTFPTNATLASTTNLTAGAIAAVSGAVGSVTGSVGSVVGHTAQTGDTYALANGVNGFVAIKGDTAAILVDTGTTLDGRIPAALVGGRMDSNASAIDGNAAAAANLKQSTLGIVTAVVGAASTITSIVTSSMSPAAAVTDQFKGRIVTFAEDTTTVNLRGQSTDITGNTALGVLTVTALTTAPVSGDTFSVT